MCCQSIKRGSIRQGKDDRRELTTVIGVSFVSNDICLGEL